NGADDRDDLVRLHPFRDYLLNPAAHVGFPDEILSAPERWVLFFAQGLAQLVGCQAVAVHAQVVFETPLPVSVIVGLATPLGNLLVDRATAFRAPKILRRWSGRLSSLALAGSGMFFALVFGVFRRLLATSLAPFGL